MSHVVSVAVAALGLVGYSVMRVASAVRSKSWRPGQDLCLSNPMICVWMVGLLVGGESHAGQPSVLMLKCEPRPRRDIHGGDR